MPKSVFKCSKCGSFNYIGDTACRKCRQKFQYNCPFCGSSVQGGSAKCNSCGNPLSWPLNQNTAIDGDSGIKVKQSGERRESWVWPLAGLILIIAIAVVGVFLFIRMIEKPLPSSVSANLTDSRPATYMTADIKPPAIANIAIKNISYNTVEITWSTDEPSTSQVKWRIADGSYNSTVRKDALLKDHSVELPSLIPKTSYYYRVISSDQFNNTSESEERKFDIGKQPGIAKVEVLWHSMSEQSPPPLTFIKGTIRNTGEITLRPMDIEVAITIEVTGRQGFTEVIASIDNAGEEIKPGESRNFSTTVPNNTKPNYTISPRILY